MTTVLENLRGMLEDAIALKRPAAEIEAIRRALDAYKPQEKKSVYDVIPSDAWQS